MKLYKRCKLNQSYSELNQWTFFSIWEHSCSAFMNSDVDSKSPECSIRASSWVAWQRGNSLKMCTLSSVVWLEKTFISNLLCVLFFFQDTGSKLCVVVLLFVVVVFYPECPRATAMFFVFVFIFLNWTDHVILSLNTITFSDMAHEKLIFHHNKTFEFGSFPKELTMHIFKHCFISN